MQRNIELDDIVIICDDNAPRNEWRLARVSELFPSSDGLVRSVKLQLATAQLDSNGKRLCDLTYLARPVHKLILLLEAQCTGVFPTEGAFYVLFCKLSCSITCFAKLLPILEEPCRFCQSLAEDL